MSENIVITGWLADRALIVAGVLFVWTFLAGAWFALWVSRRRRMRRLQLGPLISDEDIAALEQQKQSAAIGLITAAVEDAHDPSGNLAELTLQDQIPLSLTEAAAYQRAQSDIIFHLLDKLAAYETGDRRDIWQNVAEEVTSYWHEQRRRDEDTPTI
ncbi:hypothetical protein [Herbidospora cretacea]|uniref:hypothetical protein n=1 Tax=Herbidospora cretacea TaxID=28444 RepID=UPI000774BC8D|nr:hypothetical protein [Herbidospora cretacea]